MEELRRGLSRPRRYEADNASGLANGKLFLSLGSRDKPEQNADGIYHGPKAPNGKGSNWQATVPGKGYFAILRLYGPTEAATDKSWKPGDLEKIQLWCGRGMRDTPHPELQVAPVSLESGISGYGPFIRQVKYGCLDSQRMTRR